MRHEPAFVGGVARIAAAEMIIDAALAHAIERQHHQRADLGVAGAQRRAPQQFEDGGIGEFRRAANAAMRLIDNAGGTCGKIVEEGARVVLCTRRRAFARAAPGAKRSRSAVLCRARRGTHAPRCAARRRRPDVRSAQSSENTCRPRTARRPASRTSSAASRLVGRAHAARSYRCGRCPDALRDRL